ncbi:hypothetical protein PR202_ga03370 [Eleusine coracana subsp. coracana]|uniref:RmlD-like substrate binding domain-containing protein n=1 Tax=Eleusine coracana subsp. coracana TaxID=191504 RepID=A0AAV5BLY5_ELECO|nr:hypothetical protein PR202_ga03370 [Eleusine coracana subsp. coracana]
MAWSGNRQRSQMDRRGGRMAEEEERKRVLVVGGSGYLGQHLLAALASACHGLDVAFTYNRESPPQPLLDALPSLHAFRADLRSGHGLDAISASFGEWMDSVLSQGQQVDFFNDEFRCPVYVKDMVDVIMSLAKTWLSDGKRIQVLLNVGGPNRVSRLQMAESVADVRGYSHSIIKSVSASSVNRGVASPSDISMDISKLIQMLGIKPISFHDGVKATLDAEAST